MWGWKSFPFQQVPVHMHYPCQYTICRGFTNSILSTISVWMYKTKGRNTLRNVRGIYLHRLKRTLHGLSTSILPKFFRFTLVYNPLLALVFVTVYWIIGLFHAYFVWNHFICDNTWSETGQQTVFKQSPFHWPDDLTPL